MKKILMKLPAAEQRGISKELFLFIKRPKGRGIIPL